MMAIHNWNNAPVGFFHHFHQRWTGNICDSLNDGRLPSGFYALVEQHHLGVVPDVLTLQRDVANSPARPRVGSGVALATAMPKTSIISRASESESYATKADRVAIRNPFGEVVSVIEIVSPGNKHSRQALRQFLEKSVGLLRDGVHLLLIDLFPPTSRDPQGLHQLIWDEVEDGNFQLPPHKPLTLASYCAGYPLTAFVEPVAIGDHLPEMPVFVDAENYVPLPLEVSYATTWLGCPVEFREAIEAGRQ